MKSSKIALIVGLSSLLLSSLLFFKKDNKKIGYVYVDEIISEHYGMIDYNKNLKIKKSEFKEKLDRYYFVLQEKTEFFKKNKKKLDQKEISERRKEIFALEENHRRLKIELDRQYDSIANRWLDPIYIEINDNIKLYSIKNGYDYILGNLGNGNIMFGNNTHNITLDIIDLINSNSISD